MRPVYTSDGDPEPVDLEVAGVRQLVGDELKALAVEVLKQQGAVEITTGIASLSFDPGRYLIFPLKDTP